MLRGIVARPRLFDALSSVVPVAWISAPPGAGKTALAASYCDAFEGPSLWYRVDSGDGDPAALFHYLRELASAQGTRRSPLTLPTIPPEGGVDLGVFARRFFRAFFAALPARSIWVIDNFEEARGPALALVLREAFQEIPEGIAVIVLSLVEPPPELVRFTATGQLHRLGAEELCFTETESNLVVGSRLAAGPAVLSDLYRRSLGWAAGLVLMVDHLHRADPRAMPSVAESQATVFDFFAAEVLADFSALEQRTLMLTAVLPHVTPRLAQAMSAQSDAASLLDHLHRHHFFISRQGSGEPRYEYHGLFKQFLLARAIKELDPTDRFEGAARAALLLEHDDHVDEAMSIYIAAGHTNAVARLVVREAPRMYDEGRWRTLLYWIGTLPAAFLNDRPWLAYWAGTCRVWSDAAGACAPLESSFATFADSGDVRGQMLAAGALSRARILDTDWSKLDQWIDILDALLSKEDATLEPGVVLTAMSRLLYVTLARQPQHPQLATWASRTQTMLELDGHPSAVVLAGYSLLFYFTWTGQAEAGERVLARIAPLVQVKELSSISRVYWLFAHSNYVLRFGQPGAALALIDAALELAMDEGLTIAGVIRRHRIGHLLTLGRLGEAESQLAQLAQAPRIEPYHELRAWLALSQGRTLEALDAADTALRQATERGRTFYRVFDLSLASIIAASKGDTSRALDHLRGYVEATLAWPGRFTAFQGLLTEAYLEQSRGALPACHRALRRALEIGRDERFRSCWGWSPSFMTPLLGEALAQGIESDYCHELIRTHRLVPPSIDAEHWPWPVRIRTLGHFQVELDGVALRFEGKTQRKPLAMLKILVAAGGRSIPIDELIEHLWPTPEEGGRKALDITIHRLRKLLACESAVSVADRHVVLDARFVWVDAWSLERLLEPLVAIAGGLADAQSLEAAATRAFALFRGPFLADESDAPWVLATRHRVAGRIQRFATLLGAGREAARQWESAGALYQRMIELDPLAESFYRRHMICLQAEARHAEAIEVFRRCRHMLSTRLGIAPGRDTELVYQELVDS